MMQPPYFGGDQGTAKIQKILSEITAPNNPKGQVYAESAKLLSRHFSMEENLVLSTIQLVHLTHLLGLSMSDIMHLLTFVYAASVSEEDLAKETARLHDYAKELGIELGIPVPPAPNTISTTDLERMFHAEPPPRT